MDALSDCRVPVIAGLTASGKSALAMDMADRFGGEIINADAMQVYRGFDIGTAKPTQKEQSDVPHHLIDIRDARETYSVAHYVKDAVAAIRAVLEKDRIPIVCGGTGQYTTALLNGTRFWPLQIPASIEQEVDHMIAEYGFTGLLEHIRSLDPATAAKLSIRDEKRIRRFFQVFNATGMTRTEMNDWSNQGKPQFQYRPLCLVPEQHVLTAQIEARTRAMYSAGLVAETKGLLEQFGDPALIPFSGIGYRHTVSYLQGQISDRDMLDLTIRDTRRLAKRQRTWYRHHDHGPMAGSLNEAKSAYLSLMET